jgi:curved DNA-binding protein CbpA
MSQMDDQHKPRACQGVDFKSFKTMPTPEEFFVLSRIDGALTVGQLVSLCGLGREKTYQALTRLLEFGLIELPAPSTDQGEKPRGTLPPTAATPRAAANASPRALTIELPISISDFPYDEGLLHQAVELDDDFKREVICVASQLSDMSYYALFGLTPEASRKEIRNAYFALSKRYHPDLFFRKVLGDFGPMIEKIFQRTTKAYQTLSDRNKKEDYDRSLARGRAPHVTPTQVSTPASQNSETIEEIVSDRKREMAYNMLVERGDKESAQGNWAAAIEQYRKALSLKRHLPLALRVCRMLFDKAQRPDDAITFARAALKITAENVDAYVILGEIYESKNSIDEAIFHFERALKLAPERTDVRARMERLKV